MSVRHRRARHPREIAPELKGWDCTVGDPSRPSLAGLVVPGGDEDEIFFGMSLDIGLPGSEASDLFYTAVATPRGLHSDLGRRLRPRGVPPIVVNPYRWESVQTEIHRRLAQCAGPDWATICNALRQLFLWEYEGMGGQLQARPG